MTTASTYEVTMLQQVIIIGKLPKLCVKIRPDSWFVCGPYITHFVVIVNDVMNDNMAASVLVWVRSFIGPDF